MRKLSYWLLGLALVITGCTSGNSPISPPFQSTNLNTTKLQIAIGTANYMGLTAPMLNTVVTFRKPDGSSAVGVSTPTLTGPFTVPVGTLAGNGNSNIDAGTHAISGSLQTLNPTNQTSTTFLQSGGAFSYGFLPDNYDTFGSPNFGVYPQPFYTDVDANFTAGTAVQAQFFGGPPAYPNPNDGNHPAGFTGYPQGFTIFDLAPAIGAYSLSVFVGSSNAPGFTATANASLASLTVLPAFAAPTFTEDGAGGGTVALVVPAGVLETLVYIQDSKTGKNYTLLTKNSGAVILPLSDNLGSAVPGGVAVPTIGAGDPYQVIAVGFDYPAFEAGPPGNTQQTPTIVGGAGHADLTVSLPLQASYGTVAGGSSKRHQLIKWKKSL